MATDSDLKQTLGNHSGEGQMKRRAYWNRATILFVSRAIWPVHHRSAARKTQQHFRTKSSIGD